MRSTALVVGLFLLVAAAATVSPALAQPIAANPSDVAADFNNDGVTDLAIGFLARRSGVLRTRSLGR